MVATASPQQEPPEPCKEGMAARKERSRRHATRRANASQGALFFSDRFGAPFPSGSIIVVVTGPEFGGNVGSETIEGQQRSSGGRGQGTVATAKSQGNSNTFGDSEVEVSRSSRPGKDGERHAQASVFRRNKPEESDEELAGFYEDLAPMALGYTHGKSLRGGREEIESIESG